MRETVEPTYFTVSEAARELRVNPSTVWRWIDSGKLRALRVGGRSIRIKKDDLEALLLPSRSDGASHEGIPWARPVTPEELARRRALFERTLKNREKRNIAPLTTADLVHMARREAGVEE